MAYDPKILLKVVLLGYARGLVSSRKMEQACRENVTFMALACGQRPDHSTIAAFVSSMRGVCEYPGGEEVGSIYVAGEDQGEHPVDAVLYGSQYWEDYELWVCLEGLKEEKYIKIEQNICWNRISSKIWVRNSWKSILTPNSFLKYWVFRQARYLYAPKPLRQKL